MLRDYQFKSKNDIYTAWQDSNIKAVIATMATGAGKTVLYSNILQEFDAPAVLVAHRSELVSQSALALNRERVPHSIIAPKATVDEIVRLEMDTHGYTSYAWRAPIRVAGVDTLVRMTSEPWLTQIALLAIDEAHHVVIGNKWGKVVAMMPQARVLGVTAHATRADGLGLGREADGVFDVLVQGPHGRELINRGFLTDYRMLVPPTDVDFSDVAIGSTGDYKINELRAATHKAKQLCGDIVKHYLRVAPGKLGLTFAVDIEAANELCSEYRKAGVPAEIITGNTSIRERATTMRHFRERRILQLVSVDVLGEGTDVPAVEVISLGRRTASWQLMCQQIGRGLRVDVDEQVAANWGSYSDAERVAHIAASRKPRALILDHVGNLLYHHRTRGFPDSRQEYSLLRPIGARGRGDLLPLRTCLECYQPYERFLKECPYCHAVPEPSGGGMRTLDAVAGDLVELDPAALKALQDEVARIDGPVILPGGIFPHVKAAITKNHHARYMAQLDMRRISNLWAGYQQSRGLTDREIQRLFFDTFAVDVLTAQTYNVADAVNLQARVQAELDKNNVIGAANG